MNRSPKNSLSLFTVVTWILNSLLLLVLTCSVAKAQDTDTSRLGIEPGAPVGSYRLNGFENVNLFNGNLNFSLPFSVAAGRGSVEVPLTLSIEQHWKVKQTVDFYDNIIFYPDADWGVEWKPAYGPGYLISSSGVDGMWFPCYYGGGNYSQVLTRLTFMAPDGTEYQLRDKLTGGQPASYGQCSFNGNSRGTEFVTADGTAATFISDAPIYDLTTGGEDAPSGYLLLRDGTRYRIQAGFIQWMLDRNGNRLTFTYTNAGLTKITDSLNREITITYGVSDVAPYGLCDHITFKGFGGATRTIRISHISLNNVLRSGNSLQTYAQLFPDLNGSGNTSFNPTKVSGLWLPNGTSYKFYYNSYGELARVELPTAGAIEYDWAAGVTGNTPSGTLQTGFDIVVYRRVVERRLYADGVHLTNRMTVSRPESFDGNTVGYVDSEAFDADGHWLNKDRHYFFGKGHEAFGISGAGYSSWKYGKEYKTEVPDSTGAILRRVENTWQQRAAVSWWTASADIAPANDPRITQTTTTIEPASANLVSKQTFGYDDSVPYNNPNNRKEYDFSGGSPGTLMRETRTTFVTSGSYTSAVSGVHLRSLPSQVSIFDAGGIERSRTSVEYDNYTVDANHAALVDRPNISGFDGSFTTTYLNRGNVTAATSYLLTNGTVTGSMTSYAQYDIAGNVVKAIDGRGSATLLDYSDRFGAPDGDACANSGSAELNAAGQYSYALATKSTNPLGHTTYSQFDYYLRSPVDIEDSNAVVSSLYHNDPLDRLTQIRRAVGTGASNQTAFNYDDVNRIITTTSDLYSFNDNVLTSKTIYDGLGRTIETRQYEGGSNYIATQTQYDALARPFKTSNPFRPWQSQTAVFTTQAFDALGRVVSVTTPDNALVSTSYSGNSVTVTDQAGKSRKSVTDGLGRLLQVYEDPNGLNYLTSYTYDVLDNLVKVTQGSQQRFFMYDSLKRLIRARNPEQTTYASLNLSDTLTGNSAWSVGYQYDANGNLTQKTDPRGVVSTFAYDVLNRNTTLDYSDTTSINPDIKRFYDGATNGKGRFWYNYSGGDLSTGSNVEHTAIDSYDSLGRPLVQRQLFKLNGTWSGTYQISRTYNRAGAVASQTYPSGHAVTYNYDAAGRVADKDASNLAFTGNLGDGVQRTYSSGTTYTQWGSLFMEKFGTQTPLYHKLQYNIRGQLWDVRVATGSDVNGSWNRGALQFFYEPTYTHGASGPTNNGNVLKSSHYVPDAAGAALAIPHQLYTYDSLNRLTSVADYFISDFQTLTQTSLQSYNYDRWGNRTIKSSPDTWGTGINNKQFNVDSNTNRLVVPGGQSGVMSYDNAGNLINDTYTGAGTRTYDAENRMMTAADNMGQTSRYTYNADGQRVRRQVTGSQEQWQIYGFEGELLAEYQTGPPDPTLKKEYGYRNGQLLITAESPRTNVALSANGATASASSQISGNYPASSTINGDRRGLNWNNGGGWNDATVNMHPDWLEIDFNGSKTIDEINVFTLQDNPATPAEPTESMTFTLYGLTGYSVQYWNGSAWATVTGGSVSGNNKVWKKFTFTAITTTKIRVLTSSSADVYSRITEVEAWGNEAPPARTNFALGGLTSASSQYSANYPAFSTINGDRRGLNWNNGGGWNDATVNTHPDWLEIDLNGSKTIDEISVFTLQDNPATPAEPTESMTFTLYGLTGYSVQYWNGSAWTTVTGGSVTGNNKVWRKFTFTAITTTKIRVLTSSPADAYSRLTEVEAWGPTETGASGSVRWLVPDHLGTPRMILDQTGNLAGVRRHDYLPFGEELFAGTGGRTVAMGYAADGVRQQFTSKERDIETGVDFFEARYYASMQGRFTSIDPYNIVMERQFATNTKKAESQFTVYLSNPQRWARYTYALNNPLLYTDPHGEDVTIYYRPAGDNTGSRDDSGHILIYVKNDETGESAYYDYIATGDYNNIGTTQLNGVNQERIDRHASITIETNASQEQAILEGIKSAQESSPDYSVNPTKALTHTESTCASNVIKLLSLGGINVGPSLMPQSPKAIWQSAFKQYGDFAGNQGYLPPPNPLFPHSAPVTNGYHTNPQVDPKGREYGHDPRGQARVLDRNATNNYTINFRGGKRVP